MPRSLVAIVARLERIRDLSGDLSRELSRDHGQTATTKATVEAIQNDIDAVRRALSPKKRT